MRPVLPTAYKNKHLLQEYVSKTLKDPQRRQAVQVCKWCNAYFLEFLTESTIHGVVYFSYWRKRPFETLFWLLVWMGAVYAAISIILSTWDRFLVNPTVITVYKDYLRFNSTFPAGTFCPEGGYNSTRAEEYINEKWSGIDEQKRIYYRDFLSNITYISNDSFSRFKHFEGDPTIAKENLYDIFHKVQKDFTCEMRSIFDYIHPMITLLTDEGLCYVFSHTFFNFSYDRRKAAINSPIKMGQPLLLNMSLTNGLTSILKYEDPGKVYTHAPWELADSRDKFVRVANEGYHHLTYNIKELTYKDSLHMLSVSQRRCRFSEESNIEFSTVYTYTLCLLQCRMRLANKFCGCSPYFYPRVDYIKQCNISGMVCLSSYSFELQNLRDPTTQDRFPCGCVPLCHKVTYTMSQFGAGKVTMAFMPSEVTWKVIELPTYQWQRKILFGPVELFVSFGGTTGLFLGCSILSVIDSVYFYTLRLFWRLINGYFSQRRKVSNHLRQSAISQQRYDAIVFRRANYPINYYY